VSSPSRPEASGWVNIGAAILEQLVIAKILMHQGLEPQPRRTALARIAELPGHEVA
jgi:hypothetical protein